VTVASTAARSESARRVRFPPPPRPGTRRLPVPDQGGCGEPTIPAGSERPRPTGPATGVGYRSNGRGHRQPGGHVRNRKQAPILSVPAYGLAARALQSNEYAKG